MRKVLAYRFLSLAFLSTILFSNHCLAGFIFSPSFSFLESEDTDLGDYSRGSDIDIRLGYQFKFGFYIGALYSLSDQEFDDFSLGNSGFLAGPTVGLTTKGMYLFVTGIVVGDRDLNTGLVKYTRARGLQIDLGYAARLSKNFRLGPQLTYKTIEYQNAEFSGIASPTDYNWDAFTPYITLWLQF